MWGSRGSAVRRFTHRRERGGRQGSTVSAGGTRSRRRGPDDAERRRPCSAAAARPGDGESACKRDSVIALRRPVTIHLMRPTRRCPARGRDGRAARASCSALLRMGFAEPPGSPRTLVRSYRTVSPSPVTGHPAHRRSLSVALIRQVAPTWLSPAPCSVESRLSST